MTAKNIFPKDLLSLFTEEREPWAVLNDFGAAISTWESQELALVAMEQHNAIYRAYGMPEPGKQVKNIFSK